MHISYRWLQELVHFDLTPTELADRLTLVGFEVEGIEDLSTWASGVVVGKILNAEPHPQAQKLQVCTVDVGAAEPLTIVCGAANAQAGLVVPVATLGAYLPHKNLTIEKTVLRGVPSEGMICSLAELGLAKKSEGIHIFDPAPPLGADVRPILGLDDVILEVSSTANRADALSVVGIAREVAAFSGGILRLPVAEMPLLPPGALEITVASSQACPAYIATVVTGLKLAPAPQWLAQRIERAGMRSINNIVDITNYVLLEWGQPLHAFDLERLSAGPLGVRFAQPGETLTTLDGTQRDLVAQNLVITSNDQPVALAGVMGGADSEVNATTHSIVLEAALFDPAVTRRSARSQGLRSEASARYERGVDFSALEVALARALALLQELAGGTCTQQVKVDYRSQQSPELYLDPVRVARVLGQTIAPEEIYQSLVGYGFEVIPEDTGYRVRVPGFRTRDIQTEIDLIEEIARWKGYDQFPVTLPAKSEKGSISPTERVLRRIRAALRGSGLTELCHSTFTPVQGAELATKRAQLEARLIQGPQVTVLNPLAVDYGALRAQLFPGLLAAYKYNLDQGNGPLWGFEMGRVFEAGTMPPSEADHLGAVLGGDATLGDWQHRGQAWDYFALKGLVENLAQVLSVSFTYQPLSNDPRLHPGRTASIWLGQVCLGWLGQIHPRLAKAEDLPEATFCFELDLALLLSQSPATIQYQSFSSYPALERDIALFAPGSCPVAEIQHKITQVAGPLLEQVDLFDQYIGTGVPEGMRSLAFRLIFRSPDRTLSDTEIRTSQEQIRAALIESFGVQLRS